MKTNLSQKQQSRMSRKTAIVVATSSIFLIVVSLLLIFNTGNIRSGFAAPVKRTITTIKDGNWNDGSIWSTGTVPNGWSSDSIVILNNVNFNVDFTTGSGTKTGVYIGTTGNLNNNGHVLTLEKYASFYNKGTLNIKTLTFNGNGANDPVSYITNIGTMTLGTGLNDYNLNFVINNSGTMTIGGDSKINGKLTNSGTISISGNFDSDYGSITNSGSISGTGSSLFDGTSLTNTTSNSIFKVGTSLTLNYGSGNNSVSTIINAGTLTVGTPSSAGSITINDGTITNGTKYVANKGPKVNLYGSLTMNGGTHSDTDKVINNGQFIISGNVTSYQGTLITNSDSMTIGGNLNATSIITDNKLAYLGIAGDFTNNSGTGTSLTNNGGYIYVAGNFTNNWSAIFTGTGGGMVIMKNYVNHGTVTGTTDVCDKTPNTTSDVNGTMANTVTTCSYTPPKTGPSALPVTLTTFSAKKEANRVLLNWTTASEINNDRFEIERSEDGASFTILGSVKGNGTKATITNYSYSDENPLSGIAYYRLHQYDYNGKSEYSGIVVVHATGAAKEPLSVNVYPNPVSPGSSLHIELNVPVAEMVQIDLIDMAGVNIYKNESQVESGKQDKEITLPGNLNNGIYVLNIVYRGQVTSKKIQIR